MKQGGKGQGNPYDLKLKRSVGGCSSSFQSIPKKKQGGGTTDPGCSSSSEACCLQGVPHEKVEHELALTLNENEELIMVSSAESALQESPILQASLTSKSKLLKHLTITLLFSLVKQIDKKK